MTIRTVSRARSCLRRFARDRTGVSAVEFALMLPVMLTLYIGAVEVGNGYAISFKSTLAARTVTDLASQYISIYNSDMTNILGAASTVLTPYPNANVVVTLSEVTTNAQGVGKVVWSNSLNGTARVAGIDGSTADQASNAEYHHHVWRSDLPLHAVVGLRAHRHDQHLPELFLLSPDVDHDRPHQFLIDPLLSDHRRRHSHLKRRRFAAHCVSRAVATA